MIKALFLLSIIGFIILLSAMVFANAELFSLVFTDGAMACKGLECFTVWVGSFERQDMIDFCQLGDDILGCFTIRVDPITGDLVRMIALEIGHEYDYTSLGCTIYNHEMLHAWGYSDTMIGQFFTCGQPSMFGNATLPYIGFWK